MAFGGLVLFALAVCALVLVARGREGWEEGTTVTGKMTHYAGSEEDLGFGTGTLSYMGTKLQANRSVAVKKGKWNSMGCRRVKVGKKTYIVDNVCGGGGCRDLDLYLGDNVDDAEIARRGVKTVKFKVGPRDAKCMRKCRWNCPKTKRRR